MQTAESKAQPQTHPVTEPRVKLTKIQEAAIREDNIAGSNLLALVETEIVGIQAEIEAKQRLIQARRATFAAAVTANKRFTDMLVREAGLDPDDYEKYEIKNEPDGPVMVLTPKPKPGASPEELDRQKKAALAEANKK